MGNDKLVFATLKLNDEVRFLYGYFSLSFLCVSVGSGIELTPFACARTHTRKCQKTIFMFAKSKYLLLQNSVRTAAMDL